MLNIFVDTNFFIQCKDKEQIKWDLLVSDDVNIIVPITVSRQLDSFKTDGNRRRSSRAKKVLPFIKELAKGSEPCISYNGLSIIFKMAKRFPVGPPKNPILDLNDADDKIINEILSWHEVHNSEDVALLTDDAGVHITCSQCEIECLDVPREWFLPPEKDDSEREILALKEEIKLLKSDSPDIVISLGNNSDGNEHTQVIPLYDDLSQFKIDEFTNYIKSVVPRIKDFSQKKKATDTLRAAVAASISMSVYGSKEWRVPSERSIEEYNMEYDKWEDSISDFFNNLAQKLNMYSKRIVIPIHIANTGVRPAEGAITGFELLGGFIFSKIDIRLQPFNQESKFEMPSPSKAPLGRFVSAFDSKFSITNLTEEFSRPLSGLNIPLSPAIDPFAFYKHEVEDSEKFKKYHIQEFRHETVECFELAITPTNTDRECNGILRCIVSAKNIKKSAQFDVKLKTTFIKGDIESKAQELLNQTKKIGWRIGKDDNLTAS